MSKFKEGDVVRFIERRATDTGRIRPSQLSEKVAYTLESTSYVGVKIDGVWYHEDLFELTPKPVSPDQVVQIGPEGLRIGTGEDPYGFPRLGRAELVSVRVPPTVDEIRARWNVDYNYDMNMANAAPEDIKILLAEIDRLNGEVEEASVWEEQARATNLRLGEAQVEVDHWKSEAERYQHESRDSAADNGRHIREKNEAVATLTAVEEAFYEAFKPDFVAWDWRDDDTIQTFANKFVHLLVAWKAKAKK